MTKESRDFIEMAFRSIDCFIDDGKLDVGELDRLVEIALRDGEVDDNERRVLANIINRLNARDLNARMRRRVQQLIDEYDLDAEIS